MVFPDAWAGRLDRGRPLGCGRVPLTTRPTEMGLGLLPRLRLMWRMLEMEVAVWLGPQLPPLVDAGPFQSWGLHVKIFVLQELGALN